MAKIVHGTLVPDEITTVMLVKSCKLVEVLNRDRGAADIYVTTNGAEPAVEGTDCEVVPGGTKLYLPARYGTAPVIKLVSSGSPRFSVGKAD